MAVLIERKPWLMLDEWRGKMFTDEWPTLPQLFFISAERFPNRPCFTDFEGEGGAKNTGLLKCKCSSSDLLCTPTIKPYIE